MSDSDHTPPDRPRNKRLQTATDRDFDGLKHRAQREARRSPAMGTPVVSPPRVSHHSDQLEQLAIAVDGPLPTLRRMGTTFEASVILEDGIPEEIDFDTVSGVTETMREDPDKLELLSKIEREKKARDRAIANAVVRAMGEKPPAEQMSDLEKSLRRWKRIIVLVAVPAVTAAAFVFRNLSEKAATEERARIELELLRDHDHDYEQRLRALEAVTPRYPFTPSPSRPDASPSRKEP